MSNQDSKTTLEIFVKLHENVSSQLKIINQLIESLGGSLESAEKKGKRAAVNLKTSFSEFGEALKDVLEFATGDFENHFFDVISHLRTAFNLLTGSIKLKGEAHKAAADETQKSWKTAADAINTMFKDLIGGPRSKMGIITSNWIDFFGDTMKAMKIEGEGSADAIKKAYKSALTAVANTLAFIGGQFGEAAGKSSKPAYFAEIGVTIGVVAGKDWLSQLLGGIGSFIGGIASYWSHAATKASFRNYGRELGLTFSSSFFDEYMKLVKELTGSGFSKHAARVISQMTLIPKILKDAVYISQQAFDRMLWTISHSIEEMRKAGRNTFQTFQAVVPAINALADQIKKGAVEITDHFKAIISGMFQAGLVSTELFNKFRDKLQENDVRAWLSEMAIGLNNGALAVDAFSTQFSLLFSEALKRGIDATGTAKRGTVPPAKKFLHRHSGLTPFCGRIVQPATVGLASCRTNIVGADLPVAA